MAWLTEQTTGGLNRVSSNQANNSLSTVTFYTVCSTTNVYTLSSGLTLQKLAIVNKMRSAACKVSVIETHTHKERERECL